LPTINSQVASSRAQRAAARSGRHAIGWAFDVEGAVERAVEGHAERSLQRIHALGVGISIDDFGTGYSLLSYLNQLPIDTVKIDRSFVMDIGLDPSTESIINAILMMSSSLGLRNVAEGIETEEQIRFFESSSCDILQGYLFSKPLSIEEVWAKFAVPEQPFRAQFQSIALGL
jgi:EAL domain-containing protein (putative c-di-GMP-specific phosphodiesterase class I)